jgi:hypothetical protein
MTIVLQHCNRKKEEKVKVVKQHPINAVSNLKNKIREISETTVDNVPEVNTPVSNTARLEQIKSKRGNLESKISQGSIENGCSKRNYAI